MKYFALTLMVGSLATNVQAASYYSDFDSSPYVGGANLSGLDGWNLSGASILGVAIIESSFLLIDPARPTPSGGQAIQFGYQAIDAASAYLYRESGRSLVGNGMGYTEFQTAYTVQDSTSTYPNRDIFQFTFRGAANENILTIQLEPTAQTASPTLNTRTDQYSWTSDFATGSSNIGTLNEGQWSTLNVKFTPSGLNDVAFSVKFQDVELASGTLTGAASQNLGT